MIEILIFLTLALLAGRLYFLQIEKGEHYREMTAKQRVPLLPVTIPYEAIFDRCGKIPADSTPRYRVGEHLFARWLFLPPRAEDMH